MVFRPHSSYRGELQMKVMPLQFADKCDYVRVRTTKPTKTETNHLHSILLNTRYARKHAIELWDLLDSTAPDVAFLTETWWNDSSAPDISIAIPDGYKIIRRDRNNGIGGGITIAHKSSLKVDTHTYDSLKTPEHLHFGIHTDPNTTLRGTLIYRPPGPGAPFSESLADLTSTHALTSTDYILLGDLNFHLENNNDTNYTTLIDNLTNHGLRQLVNTPTHIAGHTLDPIFSSSAHVTFNHTTYSSGPTTTASTSPTRNIPSTIAPNNHPADAGVTEDQFTNTLAHNPPPVSTDPDTAAHNLTLWTNDCANTHTPLKKSTDNQARRKATWFTDELLYSKRDCRKLKKEWLLKRTPDSLTAHKDATHKHHQLIRQAKRSHFKDRLDNNAHNSKSSSAS
ncbi:hypothetical protein NDU88_003065 [Pleurodeles waltl]|uniref:Endonuclease/exonuclease/phosphatase domain-containing protein n=1 Tax=Pleurodeles waltl TaxID=8319 RepID=A0AAV7PB29_PLEWA|nr:hypothetical protein NDU88_003065 [Pleurodeles waltl]